jgi:hypothetical protein
VSTSKLAGRPHINHHRSLADQRFKIFFSIYPSAQNQLGNNTNGGDNENSSSCAIHNFSFRILE